MLLWRILDFKRWLRQLEKVKLAIQDWTERLWQVCLCCLCTDCEKGLTMMPNNGENMFVQSDMCWVFEYQELRGDEGRFLEIDHSEEATVCVRIGAWM